MDFANVVVDRKDTPDRRQRMATASPDRIKEMNRLRFVCFKDAQAKMEKVMDAHEDVDWTPSMRESMKHLAKVGAEKAGTWCGDTDQQVQAQEVTAEVEETPWGSLLVTVVVQSHPPYSRSRKATGVFSLGRRGGLSYTDQRSPSRARLQGKRKAYRGFWGAI